MRFFLAGSCSKNAFRRYSNNNQLDVPAGIVGWINGDMACICAVRWMRLRPPVFA